MMGPRVSTAMIEHVMEEAVLRFGTPLLPSLVG